MWSLTPTRPAAEKPRSSGNDSGGAVSVTAADVEKHPSISAGDKHAPYFDPAVMDGDYDGKPTEEELAVLRRVPGTIPILAYLICIVEFCERASYYGVQPLISNYVNRPLPLNGNGWGAPPEGTQQTAGALGMGTVVANAVTQSFSMLAYALPLVFGWLADARTGRFKLICWGVGVFGIAHVLMVVAGSKDLLANGTAKAPYFLSVYILSIGAGMFPPSLLIIKYTLGKPFHPRRSPKLTHRSHVQAQRLPPLARPGYNHCPEGDHP